MLLTMRVLIMVVIMGLLACGPDKTRLSTVSRTPLIAQVFAESCEQAIRASSLRDHIENIEIDRHLDFGAGEWGTMKARVTLGEDSPARDATAQLVVQGRDSFRKELTVTCLVFDRQLGAYMRNPQLEEEIALRLRVRLAW